jgi:hypothetical protein
VASGVVSSVAIALLGASLAQCNRLYRTILDERERRRRGGGNDEGDGGGDAVGASLIEPQPSLSHGDIMRAVGMVNGRSRAMAFSAAVTIWGVMQGNWPSCSFQAPDKKLSPRTVRVTNLKTGKATMRYFVDAPGLAGPQPFPPWYRGRVVEGAVLLYTVLPLLEIPVGALPNPRWLWVWRRGVGRGLGVKAEALWARDETSR